MTDTVFTRLRDMPSDLATAVRARIIALRTQDDPLSYATIASRIVKEYSQVNLPVETVRHILRNAGAKPPKVTVNRADVPDERQQLLEDLQERAAGFLTEYRSLPPVPDYIRATRVEDMGFDTPQVGVALFSDLHYYCVAPQTRLLTRDLRWVPAGDLGVGDAIMGFDEMPTDFHREDWPIRRYQDATITAAERRSLPVYELELSTGEKLISTGEHQWLASRYKSTRQTQWYRTDELADLVANNAAPWLLRYINPWDAPQHDYDEGFLAAAFDGEGCLVQAQQGWPSLHFGQRPNALLEAVETRLADGDFSFSESHNATSGVSSVHLLGGKETTLRFLGQIRPPRLMGKWNALDLSARRLDSVDQVRIERIAYCGEQEIVALASSSQTYIAEGFGAHNSRIDRRASNGLAEYNIDIARERLTRWRDGVLRFTQMNQVWVDLEQLFILALGDDLEGHGKMFQSQALQMSESIIFQMMGFAEDMTSIILSYLERYPHITIIKVPGNHGRAAERGRGAYTPDNFELMAWEIIAERVRHQTGGDWTTSENGVRSLTGGQIDFHIHYGAIALFDILGWLCLGRHGHGIKGLQATYTGALDNKFRLNAVVGEVINYYFKAHLHEAQSSESEIHGEVMQNGSFVGPSMLSVEMSRAAASLPSQEFMLFHPKRGKTHHYRIHVADVDEVRQIEVIGRKS